MEAIEELAAFEYRLVGAITSLCDETKDFVNDVVAELGPPKTIVEEEKIEFVWEKDGNKLELEVSITNGTKATVYVIDDRPSTILTAYYFLDEYVDTARIIDKWKK